MDEGFTDVGLALDFFKENLKGEIHITANESRKKLTETAMNSGQIENVMINFINVYNTCMEKTDNFAQFMMSYFTKCGEKYDEIIEKSAQSEDMLAVFNYCCHCVFSTGQMIRINRDEASKTPIQPGTAADDVQTSLGSESNVHVYRPETERGLMCLGGGTLGEIWKVNKRLRSNQTISEKQTQKAERLYRLSLMFRMSTEDKLMEELAPSMVERDRGGMFIPRREFLPFIRSVVDAVMKFGTEENYRKYGKNLLKVCTAEVQCRVDFYNQYLDAVNALHLEMDKTDFTDSIVEEFFNVWLRKLVHARLGEFIRGKLQKDAAVKGSRSKGGQTLRDTLYALQRRRQDPNKALLASLRSRRLRLTIQNM